MNLTAIANALNALLGTSYTADSLLTRPDMLALGLQLLTASNGSGATTISTATVTTVATNIGSVALLAANSNRRSVIIANNSTASLAVRVGGGTAAFTAGNYTQILPPNSVMPASLAFNNSFGAHLAITGIWSAADGAGFANITSFS